MARGGYRPGAGRKPGSKGRRRQQVATSSPEAQQVVSSGSQIGNAADVDGEPIVIADSPLEYMLKVLADPLASAERKDKLAIAAAPFLHKRADDQGKKVEKAREAERAAKGRFAPAPPPKVG